MTNHPTPLPRLELLGQRKAPSRITPLTVLQVLAVCALLFGMMVVGDAAGLQ